MTTRPSSTTKAVQAGGYAYIPDAFQYSSAVVALPGFRLERATFDRLLPMGEGFTRIKAHLEGLERPLAAFAACELRSSRPFSPDGFRAFNQDYAQVLRSWGILEGDDNPVARSNVCPELDPPSESCFYAFTYTVADASTGPSFVVSGGAETRHGLTKPEERIVAFGDISTEGLRQKARQTLGEMERRLGTLGFGWVHTTAVQLYTVHDFHPFLLEEIVARGAVSRGLTWHPCRPPVQMIEFEVDCRRIDHEFTLAT